MKRNYPFDPKIKHHILIAIGFGIWIFVFLYFMEPLGIFVFNNTEKLKYLPIYSLGGIVIYLSIIPLQNFLYKRDKYWSLLSEISVLLLFLILGIVIIKFLFDFIINNHFFLESLFDFFLVFYIPAVLAFFPLIILSRWGFGRYHEKKIESKKIEIKGAGIYEGLRINKDDLVFIKSSDNYVEITYLENTALKKSLIRTKISTISNDFPDLLQTHRSFLVNPFHFKQWSVKNAKTDLLLINDQIVPVSKTFLPQVKKILDFTTK